MRQKIHLSKFDYLRGLQCSLSMWYWHHSPLGWNAEKKNSAIYSKDKEAKEVKNLAKQLYPKGVDVEKYDISEAVDKTRQMANAGVKVLFDAVAQDPKTGAYARADILRRYGDGWHLIEVKSATSTKDEHIMDVAFQRLVFIRAGYSVSKCFVMHINADYVRQGELNLPELFSKEDVTQEAKAMESEISQEVKDFTNILRAQKEPTVALGSVCLGCEYQSHCWQNCPEYSIYDLFGKKTADKVYTETNNMDVNVLPLHLLPKGARMIDLKAHKSRRMQINKAKLQEFLRNIKYPVLHLDYETIFPAVPLYDKSLPYQHIPFQFSIQVQAKKGGKLTADGFLHEKKGDPRLPLIQSLKKLATASGTIIVYNMSFEKSIHTGLADNFPRHANFLTKLNERIVDLQVPFWYTNRWLYDPKQMSSASLKDVLPAFCPGEGYDGMAIAHGMQASESYLAFVKDQLSASEEEKLFHNLREYCNYDTLATAKLLDKLWALAK